MGSKLFFKKMEKNITKSTLLADNKRGLITKQTKFRRFWSFRKPKMEISMNTRNILVLGLSVLIFSSAGLHVGLEEFDCIEILSWGVN